VSLSFLAGCSALPFIDQGGGRVYMSEKEEKTRGQEAPPKALGLPFPLSRLRRHGRMVSGIGTFAGHLCVDDAMPLLAQQAVTSCPTPRAACQTGVLTYSPVGSGRRGDCTFVTVEDTSLFLDRSGCRMFMSGSAPEG